MSVYGLNGQPGFHVNQNKHLKILINDQLICVGQGVSESDWSIGQWSFHNIEIKLKQVKGAKWGGGGLQKRKLLFKMKTRMQLFTSYCV